MQAVGRPSSETLGELGSDASHIAVMVEFCKQMGWTFEEYHAADPRELAVAQRWMLLRGKVS